MSHPDPRADRSDGTPGPTYFEPSFERLPAPVSGESASAGPLLLLFDPAADPEWTADAAVALATGWTAAGRRTVLADLALEDPFLHDRIGMPNQEGVVDVFLYGASMARSARAVPGRGFYLISSGTYTPDPGAVLGSPRWEKIVASFRENDAALLLLVPADAAELDALARWVAAAVVLGGETLPDAAERFAVRAWLAPPRGGAPPPPAARPAAPAERFPEPAPGKPWTAPPGTHAEADAEVAETLALPLPEPGWDTERDAPRGRRRRSPVAIFLAFLAVVAVAGVALAALPRLVPGFPDLLGVRREAEPPAPQPGAAAPSGPVEPAGEALPYSVQVANYQDPADAAAEAERISRRYPEAQFFVVPEDVQGVTYWRLMAGMGEDTTALLALRDRLLAERVVDEEAFGGVFNVIQRRPLTYEVGEYPTATAARARADSLTARRIPAYVAPVPYTDGSERWRVYAGAYRDSATAAVMREYLRAATVEPRLVERTGRPQATPK